MSKESLEKSERTPPVSWRPWALAYSRDRPHNFSCLSAVSKNRRFRSFFSALGVIWRGKAFRDQQCQFLTRNKSFSIENESNCSMTSECMRTAADSILPPSPAPASSTVDIQTDFKSDMLHRSNYARRRLGGQKATFLCRLDGILTDLCCSS